MNDRQGKDDMKTIYQFQIKQFDDKNVSSCRFLLIVSSAQQNTTGKRGEVLSKGAVSSDVWTVHQRCNEDFRIKISLPCRMTNQRKLSQQFLLQQKVKTKRGFKLGSMSRFQIVLAYWVSCALCMYTMFGFHPTFIPHPTDLASKCNKKNLYCSTNQVIKLKALEPTWNV